nr:hypothetical protein [Tanacetum cinerariifolium]
PNVIQKADDDIDGLISEFENKYHEQSCYDPNAPGGKSAGNESGQLISNGAEGKWSISSLLALFKPSDIGGVRALRWGRNDRALSWQNPSNTGNVTSLLAPATNGHDLILSVGHTREGVGA